MRKRSAGRPPQLCYADILLLRALYFVPRGYRRPTLKELAEKFNVSHMTVKRAVDMDERELQRRKNQEATGNFTEGKS